MNVKNLLENKICPISKKDISSSLQNRQHDIYYDVEIQKNQDLPLGFHFSKKHFDLIDFKKYRSVILGLILNDKFNPYKSGLIVWGEERKDTFDLKQFLIESYYPRTPKEKYDNLISELFKNQSEIGREIAYQNLPDMFFEKCYFDNWSEFINYLKALEEAKLIETNYSPSKTSDSLKINITFEGFNYLDQLEESGSESKNCFIAMAFKNETIPARESIKKAILKTGFYPIIIDEENIDSDQTINDAIIAGIKKSKFCIADFSYHRNGVYFESGYALGLGKPVIYCCSQEEFGKAHFDIKPLQHIIYQSSEELEKKLIDKIEAWIK